jgi:hypothetical protein
MNGLEGMLYDRFLGLTVNSIVHQFIFLIIDLNPITNRTRKNL